MKPPSIHVLILAENLLARAGLTALLADYPDYSAAAAAGLDLDSTMIDSDPDVLLVDLGWNPVDSLDALEDLAASAIPLVVLIPNTDDMVNVLPVLVSGGAYGLLLRESESETLVAALGAVAAGLVALDPILAADVIQRGSSPSEPLTESLTPRENEVLQRLAQGLTNKAIAHHLEISENTVKFHVNAIMGKLNAQSRTEAVVKATRMGLIIL